MKLDYEHVLEVLKSPVQKEFINAKYLYFNDESYYSYSYTENTHFMNLQFDPEVSYYIVYWGDAKRCSITKAYVSDTFDEDTREIFKLFDMFSTEEEHFMESTVSNVEVPFEVMAEVRVLSKTLQGVYDALYTPAV